MVDFTSLSTYLSELADPAMAGRLTGAPSGELSRQYVLDALESAGFEPITQDLPLPVYELVPPVDLSLVDPSGVKTFTFDYIERYREILFAGSGDLTAPLLFMGWGRDSDYKGVDVSGQVVAVLCSGDMKRAYERAYEKGAAAVLFIPTGVMIEYDDWYRDIMQWNLFGSGEPVDEAELLPDFPALWVHDDAVEDLLGISVGDLEEDTTPFDPGRNVHLEVHGNAYPAATCTNAFVFLQGTDLDIGDEIIMVGAHYDHIGTAADGSIFCGASDNASGTAVTLELARLLQPIAGRAPDPWSWPSGVVRSRGSMALFITPTKIRSGLLRTRSCTSAWTTSRTRPDPTSLGPRASPSRSPSWRHPQRTPSEPERRALSAAATSALFAIKTSLSCDT